MPEIPFALQWTILENQLLPLKDSINGCLFSAHATNIPEFEYYLKIYPNGNNDGSRGEIWIFLQLKFKDVKKVEADFTVTMESANYSRTVHRIYEESIGRGLSVCKTNEFFDVERKFIVDGKITIKVDGIFQFDTENDIPAVIEQKWSGGALGDQLWVNSDIKDFTIIIEDGKKIKVDKFILRSRSEFFKDLLNTCSNESTLEITDFPSKVVETALKLIYDCNFTSSLSIDELMELQRFFDKYLLPEFKDKVEPLLIAQISPSTVVRLTNCSIFTNSPKLKEKCMEFLMAAFQSKTALSDIEILDKNIGMKILQNSLCQTL